MLFFESYPSTDFRIDNSWRLHDLFYLLESLISFPPVYNVFYLGWKKLEFLSSIKSRISIVPCKSLRLPSRGLVLEYVALCHLYMHPLFILSHSLNFAKWHEDIPQKISRHTFFQGVIFLLKNVSRLMSTLTSAKGTVTKPMSYFLEKRSKRLTSKRIVCEKNSDGVRVNL